MEYHYYVFFSVPKIGLQGNTELLASKEISCFEDITALKESLANQMNTGVGKYSVIKALSENISTDDIMFYGLPQLIRDEPY